MLVIPCRFMIINSLVSLFSAEYVRLSIYHRFCIHKNVQMEYFRSRWDQNPHVRNRVVGVKPIRTSRVEVASCRFASRRTCGPQSRWKLQDAASTISPFLTCGFRWDVCHGIYPEEYGMLYAIVKTKYSGGCNLEKSISRGLCRSDKG